MPVKSKSIYDPAEPGDGVRVLTTNYWPRGISRERAGTYKRVLGPSRELLRAFKDGLIDWAGYEPQYLEQMRGEAQQTEIQALAQLAATETITVTCVCREEAECHRRLLRDLIEREVESPS
ncbi:MAG: DUF488 family protein [Dehalococcoidia bacterium]